MTDVIVSGPCQDVDRLNGWADGTFIGHVGLRLLESSRGFARAIVTIAPHHLGANGYLHGGAVATFGDTVCGWGCRASLPDDAQGFVTLEFKTSFISTAREGNLIATAEGVHLGRRTQIWEARLARQSDGKEIARFACTQLVTR